MHLRLKSPVELSVLSATLLLLWTFGSFALHAGESDSLRQQRLEIEASMEVFHLDKAVRLATSISNIGYRQYYRCNISMYKYLSTQDLGYLEEFRALWDEATEALEENSPGDPLAGTMLSGLYAKRSVLEFLEGNYFRAMRMVRGGRNRANSNYRQHPKFADQLKVLGLFNVMLGSIPRRYAWMANLLGFKGDFDLGVEQLRLAASKGNLLPYESEIVLGYVERNMLGRTQPALEQLQKIRQRNGHSILTDFFLASTYQNIKRNDDALKILERRQLYYDDPEVFFLPYWDYLLGKAYYYRGDYGQSAKFLGGFLSGFRGNNFRSDALFRQAMAYTLEGDYTSGKPLFAKLAIERDSPMDEDAYSIWLGKKFATGPPTEVEQTLFRARNLFDGGYLMQAMETLAPLHARFTSLTPVERMELHYRFGRIFHSNAQYPEARLQYTLCFSQESSEQVWMKAYARFYTAEIETAYSRVEIARDHYHYILNTFDGYFYQSGLESRCKMALRDLKKQP